MWTGKPVVGTYILTDIATVNPVLEFSVQFGRRFLFILDGLVGEAPAYFKLIGRLQCICRQALMHLVAAPATVGFRIVGTNSRSVRIIPI